MGHSSKYVVQILGRRTKHNPCLLGEPGVGKAPIVEGLAQLIASVGDYVLETLLGKKVIPLDVGLLVASIKYRREFEESLKKLMEEIKQSDGEITLFIDEVHTSIGEGAATKGAGMDAANILKPALARGEVQLIGAATLDE